MKPWKVVVLGMAGAFFGVMLLAGMAFWVDIFKVEKDGTVRFQVSDKGEVAINTDATATQAGLTFPGVSTVSGDMRLSGRGAAPTGPGAGYMWYESTPKEVKYFDGGLTKPLAAMTNGALTLYVDGSKADDTGDGLTSGTAKKYIQSAVNLIPVIVRHAVTINVAAGTYRDAGVSIGSTTFNVYIANKVVMASGSITFIGNETTPSNVRVTGSNSGADTTPVRHYGFYVDMVQSVTIKGFLCNYYVLTGIQYARYASGSPVSCVSSNNNGSGIGYFSYSTGSPASCTTSNNTVHGILYANGSSGSPTSCTASSNSYGIIYDSVCHGGPSNCTVSSNTVDGISYANGCAGYIANNTGSGNGSYGITSVRSSAVYTTGTTPTGTGGAKYADASSFIN